MLKAITGTCVYYALNSIYNIVAHYLYMFYVYSYTVLSLECVCVCVCWHCKALCLYEEKKKSDQIFEHKNAGNKRKVNDMTVLLSVPRYIIFLFFYLQVRRFYEPILYVLCMQCEAKFNVQKKYCAFIYFFICLLLFSILVFLDVVYVGRRKHFLIKTHTYTSNTSTPNVHQATNRQTTHTSDNKWIYLLV